MDHSADQARHERVSGKPGSEERYLLFSKKKFEKVKEMDYKKAVELARKGKEEGFRFLYEKTYQSKYYLALQYMKNEETAKDVLQDAYIRAFSKLDSLKQPEAF